MPFQVQPCLLKFLLSLLQLCSCWRKSLWAGPSHVSSHYSHFWHSGSVVFTGSEFRFHARCDGIPSHCSKSTCLLDSKWVTPCQVYVTSHCPHCHSGPAGLIGSEWFHTGFSHVSSHCSYCHSGPVGLTGSEWFHARSSCLFSLSLALTLWSWCWLDVDLIGSEWFYVPVVSLLTILTATLVLLTWQEVSNEPMLGSAVFLLTILTAILVLLVDSEWVIPCQVSCISSHCPYCHLGPADLTASEWLHVQLPCPFSLSSLPFWSCWLDRL